MKACFQKEKNITAECMGKVNCCFVVNTLINKISECYIKIHGARPRVPSAPIHFYIELIPLERKLDLY